MALLQPRPLQTLVLLQVTFSRFIDETGQLLILFLSVFVLVDVGVVAVNLVGSVTTEPRSLSHHHYRRRCFPASVPDPTHSCIVSTHTTSGPPPPPQAGGGVDNKTVKLALATLFLNLAVAAHQEPLTGGLGDAYQQLAALYAEVLGAVTSAFADDALYRVLVGLGTLVTVSPAADTAGVEAWESEHQCWGEVGISWLFAVGGGGGGI